MDWVWKSISAGGNRRRREVGKKSVVRRENDKIQGFNAKGCLGPEADHLRKSGALRFTTISSTFHEEAGQELLEKKIVVGMDEETALFANGAARG